MKRLHSVAALVLAATMVTSGCVLMDALRPDPATVVFEVATVPDDQSTGVNGSDLGDFSRLEVRLNYITIKPSDGTEPRTFDVNRTVDLVTLADSEPIELLREELNRTRPIQRFSLDLDVVDARYRNGSQATIRYQLSPYQVSHDPSVEVKTGTTTTYRYVVVPILNDGTVPGPDGQYFIMLPQWRSGPVTS